MSVTCEICGKEFKNTQGLRGHKNFVHADTVSGIRQPVAQQPLSSNLGTRVTTEQRLDQLTTRLEKLESITGLKEPSFLDRLLGTDKPITEQLERHTRRLTELSGQLDELLSDLISKVTKQAEQISKLAVQVNSAQNEDRKLGREITKCCYDLGQLEIRLKRLSRFVQHEFAGVDDDIIWEICQDRPELKSNLRIRPRHR